MAVDLWGAPRFHLVPYVVLTSTWNHWVKLLGGLDYSVTSMLITPTFTFWIPSDNKVVVETLNHSLEAVMVWMRIKKLCCNSNKMDVLLVGSRSVLRSGCTVARRDCTFPDSICSQFGSAPTSRSALGWSGSSCCNAHLWPASAASSPDSLPR